MSEFIDPLLSWFKENLYLICLVLVATGALGYLAIRVIVVGFARWRYNRYKIHGGTRRLLRPRSWFQLQPRTLFEARNDLLASPAIREFYAPVELYKEEREPGRIYARAAWLSPFASAARASIAQNKAAIKGNTSEYASR
ncbi:hypothetical protein G7067_05240 [Leucobacter insecticola]|uniref:Uncharacterized protein n=1 Tax=Leucobacter insecticola TaxID=2714934 RepID=A0A6G8FHY3_9MICO|nr:hypothetical protein [Leucobacter insecticola]QIM15958.1 hypothetical protein G7067_05240 [Leucobacter insecticola]